MFNMFNKLAGDFTILRSVPKAVPEPVAELGPNVISKTNMTAEEKKQLYVKLTQYHKDALADHGFPMAKVEFKTIWHDATTNQDSVNLYGNQFRRNFFFEILKSSDDKKGYVTQDERVLYTVNPNCVYYEEYALANVNANVLADQPENRLYSVPLTDLIAVGVNGQYLAKVQLEAEKERRRQVAAQAPIQEEPVVKDSFELEFEQLSANDFKAEDQHYNNLSVLDLLAIIQCEPISSKEYLNQAINKINKQRK
jgi:hypothetical protein